MICNGCKKLCKALFQEHEYPKKKKYFYSARGTFEGELLDSDLKILSCEFCVFLAACWPPEVQRDHSTTIDYSSLAPKFRDTEHTLNLYIRRKDSVLRKGFREEPQIDLTFTRESAYTKNKSRAIKAHTLSTLDTKPDSCLPQIQIWLDTCARSHQQCRHHRDARDRSLWHPSRLIDVSGDPDSPLLRLEDDSEKLAGAEYATLSYCWGPNPSFFKLQDSNYEIVRRGIPLSNLPKTLQDAIILTRALGLKYIWIDALCIIQNSAQNQDWLTESLTMSDVYGRSYINIAAASSVDAEGGLFRERDLVLVNGSRLVRRDDDKDGYIFHHAGHWFDSFQMEPLSRRAWALQERRLSTRTLHFTNHQIFWECNELGASEIFPNGKPWENCWSARHKQMSDARDATLSSPTKRNDAWWNLVWEYSKGSLSMEADRLIAIAGLARAFSAVSGDNDYFAGLWRSDLPNGLLWFILDGLETQRQQPHLAPTWSWASIPSGTTIIRPDRDGLKSVCDVLDIQSENSGDSFGAYLCGSLRLCTRMCTASFFWVRKPYYSKLQFPNREIKNCEIRLDENMDEGPVFCAELAATWILSLLPHYIWLARKTTLRFTGLLLQPTGARKGEFRRVGYYSDRYIRPGNIKARPRKWQEYMYIDAEFRKCDIPEENFEELDDRGMYTIRIV